MNTILDFVYNHNGLIVLLWMLLTAVLLFRQLDAANRILQGLTLVLWLAATAFLTFFERSPVMDVRYNLIPFQEDSIYNVKSNVLLFIPLWLSNWFSSSAIAGSAISTIFWRTAWASSSAPCSFSSSGNCANNLWRQDPCLLFLSP